MGKNWIAQPKKNPNNSDRPWEVRRENADKAYRDYRTQEAAWVDAKEIARNNGTRMSPATAKLKLRRDGTFTKTRKYPSDHDGEQQF